MLSIVYKHTSYVYIYVILAIVFCFINNLNVHNMYKIHIAASIQSRFLEVRPELLFYIIWNNL